MLAAGVGVWAGNLMMFGFFLGSRLCTASLLMERVAPSRLEPECALNLPNMTGAKGGRRYNRRLRPRNTRVLTRLCYLT